MLRKKAQVGMEYLIIVGFITFIIMSMLVMSYYYVSSSKKRINENQIEVFGNKIIDSAESIFYEGQPSQITITIYVPDNVKEISVKENAIFINSSSTAGVSKRAFIPNVKLDSSSEIPATEGTHNLLIKAESDRVFIENV